MFDGLLQPWHLLIILVIVLIIFGPGKLPDLGSALGRGIKEFRGGIREIQEDLDINGNEAEQEQKAAVIATPQVSAPVTTPLAAATTPIASPNSVATSTQTAAPTATQVMAPPQATATTQVQAQACGICGTVAAPGARFCANCGNPIAG